jgi:hypothetical protein
MNPRSQMTPGGAFARVKDILSAKVCSQFLGVSEWTIYDRCDAQELSRLNISLAQAFELDAMCREKSGESPLCALYNEKLDGAPRASTAETLETAGVELARDVGEVEAEILSARAAGGRALSKNKVIDLQTSIQKARRCLNGLETIVEKSGGAA